MMKWRQEEGGISIYHAEVCTESLYLRSLPGICDIPLNQGRDLKAVAERLDWRFRKGHSDNLPHHRLTPPRVTANRHISGDVSGRFESHRHIQQRVHGLFGCM